LKFESEKRASNRWRWRRMRNPKFPSCRLISSYSWIVKSGMARMKKLVVGVALALALTTVAAKAAERAGDAALGALSGAVVLGPIGAVAGAVVGYTAGPRIARSWGLRRTSAVHGGRRMARQDAAVGDGQPSAPASARAPAYAGPPAQGLD
jgi:hypothetical protein